MSEHDESHPLHGKKLELKKYKDLMKEGNYEELYTLVDKIVAKEDHNERAYDTLGFLRAFKKKGQKLTESLESKISDELKKENEKKGKKISELEGQVKRSKGEDGFNRDTLMEYLGFLTVTVLEGTKVAVAAAEPGNYNLINQILMVYLNSAAPAYGKKKGEDLLAEIAEKINKGEIAGENGAANLIKKYVAKGYAMSQTNTLTQRLMPEDTRFQSKLANFILNRHDFHEYLNMNEDNTDIDHELASESAYQLADFYSSGKHDDIIDTFKRTKTSSKGPSYKAEK